MSVCVCVCVCVCACVRVGTSARSLQRMVSDTQYYCSLVIQSKHCHVSEFISSTAAGCQSPLYFSVCGRTHTKTVFTEQQAQLYEDHSESS